jgi:hypothetical protein
VKSGSFSFTAPRLNKTKIWEHADNFRIKYASQGDIPVSISDIIEFKLGINLDPIQGLKTSGDIEALLLGTLDTIVVDSAQFLDDRFQNRMRFSLAHEVGHLILHSEIIKKLRPASIEEWIEMMDVLDNEEYAAIEQQAYEFAGRLLVPLPNLICELKGKKYLVDKLLSNHPEISEQAIIESLSNSICKKFGVSYYVIAKRIKVEGLWPIPE